MTRRPVRRSALAAASLLIQHCIPAVAAPAPSSTKFSVRQTDRDLTAVSGDGRVVFSVRAFEAAQYTLLLREFELPPPPADGSSPLWVRHRIDLVSLAGPLLGFRDEAEIEPGHDIPSGQVRFWTVDLRRGAEYGFNALDPLNADPRSPGAIVDLRGLVADQALASAIARTPLARRAVAKVASSSPPETTDAALDSLAGLGTTKPNCFDASRTVTTSFAITQLAVASMKAVLGLSGQSYCRDNLTELHLDLPRPASLGVEASFSASDTSRPQITLTFGTEPH